MKNALLKNIFHLSGKLMKSLCTSTRPVKWWIGSLQDHMWQHKQEERELKRVEGDIIKNQRIVRMTLRDYDNGEYSTGNIFFTGYS